MFLFFVQAYQSLLFLSDAGNMNSTSFLSSCVKNAVSITKIDKSVAIQAEVACQDEAVAFAVDCFIQAHQVFSIVMVNHNHTLVITDTTE